MTCLDAVVLLALLTEPQIREERCFSWSTDSGGYVCWTVGYWHYGPTLTAKRAVPLIFSAMALRLRECDSRYGEHPLITWVEVDEDSRTIRITQEVPEWLIWRDP